MSDVSAQLLGWLLSASVHVALLVGVVLVVDRVLRRVLSPSWRHALWILAFVPLVCPVLPTTPWSPLRLLQVGRTKPMAQTSPSVTTEVRSEPTSESGRDALAKSSFLQPTEPAARLNRALRVVPNVLAAIWGVFALALVLRQWRVAKGFRRRIRRGQVVTDPGIVAELDECRQSLGLRRVVRMVETDAIGSPALTGVLRPTILLPVGLLAELSSAERHCLFLHELAHVKRWDLALDTVAGLCQVLYWFNPLVHFAAGRLRATREIACDEHVLRARSAPDWQLQYSRTLLRLAARANSPVAMPAMAGMAERTSAIETRLQSIQRSHPAGWRRQVVGACVVALVAVIGLSRAGDSPAPDRQAAAAAPVPASRPAPVQGLGKRLVVTQVILDGRVVEVRGATPEAVLEQIAELVPAGMRGKTGAAAKVGIASAADMKAAMAPRGFRLLAAPQIATVDGQAATLRTGEERYLPVGWTQRDEKGEVRKGPDGSPLATPVFGEPTHIGCVVEYTPHLAADGKSLDLEVASRIVEFVEYEDVKMADAHDPTTELTGKMAVLRTRSAVGRLTVPIGSSVCLVSNLVIEEQKKEKRVPVLGSVPFVGKAFRRSKTVPIVTGYVFFVSPTVHRAKARVPAADQKPKESE